MNKLYKDVQADLKAAPSDDFIFDDTKLSISVPVACDLNCRYIEFHVAPDLYYVSLDGLVAFNFAEGQNITSAEVIGDITDILAVLKGKKLHLVEHLFFGMKSYSVNGLDGKRFASTKTLKDILIQRLGKETKNSLVALT